MMREKSLGFTPTCSSNRLANRFGDGADPPDDASAMGTAPAGAFDLGDGVGDTRIGSGVAGEPTCDPPPQKP